MEKLGLLSYQDAQKIVSLNYDHIEDYSEWLEIFLYDDPENFYKLFREWKPTEKVRLDLLCVIEREYETWETHVIICQFSRYPKNIVEVLMFFVLEKETEQVEKIKIVQTLKKIISLGYCLDSSRDLIPDFEFILKTHSEVFWGYSLDEFRVDNKYFSQYIGDFLTKKGEQLDISEYEIKSVSREFDSTPSENINTNWLYIMLYHSETLVKILEMWEKDPPPLYILNQIKILLNTVYLNDIPEDDYGYRVSSLVINNVIESVLNNNFLLDSGYISSETAYKLVVLFIKFGANLDIKDDKGVSPRRVLYHVYPYVTEIVSLLKG